MHRLIPILVVAGGAVWLAPASASAEILYPWCIQYSGGANGIGATSCAFVSRAQCMQTSMGMGAWCVPNPAYPDAPPARERRRVPSRN